MLPLQIVHIIISVLLIASILLQQRSSGLGDAFGAGDSSVFTSRRGAEKVLYYLTIVFGLSFGVLAILQLVLING